MPTREQEQLLLPLLAAPYRLSSQTQLADDCTVALNIVVLEIVEQVPSVTDHLLQTAAAVEVLLVELEVLGQSVDAGSQNRNLNLRRTGVALVGRVLRDNRLFFVFCHHGRYPSPFNKFMRRHSSRWVKSRSKKGRQPVSGNRASVIQKYYITLSRFCK